jgi:RimJ/RimL family protein N-acetyltransferase
MSELKITLRDYCETDLDCLVALANNSKVSKYMTSSFPSPYTEADAQWWLSVGCKNTIAKAITLNGAFVGGIGGDLQTFEYSRRAIIGYWIGEPFWGQGIATEALKQFSVYMFSNTEVERLQASVFSTNLGSMRVLENAGFSAEAVLENAIYKHGVFYNEHIYRLFRNPT